MSFYDWISIAITCFIGAAFPGPSLLVILFIANSRGFLSATITSIGHGFGIFIYAILCTLGLVYFFKSFPELLYMIKIFGILFLSYLGIKMLQYKGKDVIDKKLNFKINKYNDFTLGLVIALINPKVIFFFASIFSQFIKTELIIIEKLSISLLASLIDALWYIIVAYLSTFAISNFFTKQTKIFVKTLGLSLIVLAILMIQNSFF